METKEGSNKPAAKKPEAPVTMKQINGSIKKGHFKKATDLLKKIDIPAPEKKELIAKVKVLWDKAKAEKAKAAAAKPPKPAAKMVAEPTDNQIVEAYDTLEFLLAEKTSIEKLKKRPFKFYFVHFRQVSRLKKQFERTRRT